MRIKNLLGEYPQHMINKCKIRDKFFIEQDVNQSKNKIKYSLKSLDEYYKNEKDKELYK